MTLYQNVFVVEKYEPAVSEQVFVDVLEVAGGVVAEVTGERLFVEVGAEVMLNKVRPAAESFSALFANLKSKIFNFCCRKFIFRDPVRGWTCLRKKL